VATLRTPARATLSRLKVVFGIPSTLVITGFLLTQSVVSMVLDSIHGWQGHIIWLGSIAVVALLSFQRWDRNATATLTAAHLGQSGTDTLAARRGLVIIMGLDSQRSDSAVAKLLAAAPGVEYLTLIGTPETQLRKVAAGITGTLAPSLGRAVPATHVRIFEQGNNAQSISDFEQATTEALNWLERQGLEPHEIVVDVSEGRRPMGFGALVAANTAGVEAQYLSWAWNHLENRPIPGQEIFKVVREFPVPAA
jgi:hypothetical protein